MYTPQLLFIGTQEIIIIVVLVLLLFGGKKIPELMRGLGRGVKEFKDGQREDTTVDNSGSNNTNPNDSVNNQR